MEGVFQRSSDVPNQTCSDHDDSKNEDEPGQAVQEVKSCIDLTAKIRRQLGHGLLGRVVN